MRTLALVLTLAPDGSRGHSNRPRSWGEATGLLKRPIRTAVAHPSPALLGPKGAVIVIYRSADW